MKVGKHSLQFLLDTEGDERSLALQITTLKTALPYFFGKYSLNPNNPYAARVKPNTNNEIEIHPLSGSVRLPSDVELKEDGYPVKLNGAGLAIPASVSFPLGEYKFKVYFSNEHLTNDL